MHPSDELEALASAGELGHQLDRAALLVSAALRPHVDVDRSMRKIDHIADSVPAPTMPALRHTLFASMGFTGDVENYHALENSLLDRVLVRRVGLPITLSVLAVSVGRRLGLDVQPVALPGHVIVSIGTGLWLDPFAGGRLLDRAGAELVFRRMQPDHVVFDPAYLEPVDGLTIISRMLANIAASAMGTGDLPGLMAAQDLRQRLPGTASLPAAPWRN